MAKKMNWRKLTSNEKIEALRTSCIGLSNLMMLMKSAIEDLTGKPLLPGLEPEQEAKPENVTEAQDTSTMGEVPSEPVGDDPDEEPVPPTEPDPSPENDIYYNPGPDGEE